MPKIDYTKVEASLNNWMLKMSVKELLFMADLVSSSFGFSLGDDKANSKRTAEAMINGLIRLQNDLERVRKKDAKMYENLGLKREELEQYFEHPEKLTPADWEKIKVIREQLEVYKKELKKRIRPLSNEEIVKRERRKQKSKRFNVQDDWIPLQ